MGGGEKWIAKYLPSIYILEYKETSTNRTLGHSTSVD